MESLVKGHLAEDPNRAMARSEWEAIAEDSEKKASNARELLRLKKKEEDELRAKANALGAANNAPRGHCVPNMTNRRCFWGVGRGNGGSTTRCASGVMSLHPEASNPRHAMTTKY